VISFGGIGILNTAIHTVTVIILVEEFSVSPPISQVFGFLLSNLFSYCANATFTFPTPISAFKYIKFILVSSMSLVTAVIFSIVVQLMDRNYLFGILLFVGVNPLISFALHNFITFRRLQRKKCCTK